MKTISGANAAPVAQPATAKPATETPVRARASSAPPSKPNAKPAQVAQPSAELANVDVADSLSPRDSRASTSQTNQPPATFSNRLEATSAARDLNNARGHLKVPPGVPADYALAVELFVKR